MMTKSKRKRIKSQPTPNHIPTSKSEYPTFSFRYLSEDYGPDQLTDQERKDLLNKLHRLSKMRWNEIDSSYKHGMGKEKIQERSEIKKPLPPHITKDVNISAFRFSAKKPMIGYRQKTVYYILFLDSKFEVYSHE